MSEIYFENIQVNLGRIEIRCRSFDDSLNINDLLFFELSEDILVTHNQIAIALATLCGVKYDKIFMDLEINKNIFEDIQKFTNSEIMVNKVLTDEIIYDFSENNIMLGFSGGFDSLAAYCLLNDPNFFDNLYLTSLDFQGVFAREEKFFKLFKPFTVKSNFVELKLNRNHWTFMYIPQIFFCIHLNAKYVSLSGILESGSYGLDEKLSLSKTTNDVPISFLNMKIIPFLQGLTEVGTAQIILHFRPELVDLSLKSLANPGEEKRYRKQLLTKIVADKFNKRVFYEEVGEGTKEKWGAHFTPDFLSLYFIKHVGFDEASKMVNNIPSEAIDMANSLSLDFYGKFNNNFLNVIPDEYKSKFLQRLAMADIYPYNSNDWEEFRILAKFFSQYYEDLKRRLGL